MRMPKINGSMKRNLISVCCILIMAGNLHSQAPFYWIRDEVNPGEDFILMPDDSFFTEGARSLHMQLNSGAVPYLVSEVFYVNPGTPYEFSIDVFDNDTAGQVKIYADFYDTYGFDIFGKAPQFSVDSSEWQKIAWEGTVPERAVVGYILVKYYCQPDLYHFTKTAHIWLDNAAFYNDETNLLKNGGFEDWFQETKENNSKDNVLIYPNPVKDLLKIELHTEVSTILLADMSGRQIRLETQVNENIRVLNMEFLKEGIYFLVIQYKDGSRSVEKLVKW